MAKRVDLSERPPTAERPFDILARKMRGERAALGVLEELSPQFRTNLQVGLAGPLPDQVLAAVALIRSGMTPESVSSLLTWREFEGFCASVLKAHGYVVLTNVVLTKPRRQIDIFAESQTLALCVDCKHWGRPFSVSSLEEVASEQVERTILYKQKRRYKGPVLPAILTLLDPPVREVLGVPIVPIFALGDFLASVNRFADGLAII